MMGLRKIKRESCSRNRAFFSPMLLLLWVFVADLGGGGGGGGGRGERGGGGGEREEQRRREDVKE